MLSRSADREIHMLAYVTSFAWLEYKAILMPSHFHNVEMLSLRWIPEGEYGKSACVKHVHEQCMRPLHSSCEWTHRPPALELLIFDIFGRFLSYLRKRLDVLCA
jgi:hypothetical protein